MAITGAGAAYIYIREEGFKKTDSTSIDGYGYGMMKPDGVTSYFKEDKLTGFFEQQTALSDDSIPVLTDLDDNKTPVVDAMISAGTMPSKTHQRFHPRSLGYRYDMNKSYMSKHTVEGGYNFYVSQAPFFKELFNLVYPDNVNEELKSYAIFHPLEKIGEDDAKGYVFTGMMANQFNFNIPNQDAFPDASISFMGQDAIVYTNVTSVSTDITDEERLSKREFNPGTPLVAWNSLITIQEVARGVIGTPASGDYNPDTEEGTPASTDYNTDGELPFSNNNFLPELPFDIFDFTLNVNNNLIVPDYLDNSQFRQRPISGVREITGSFTLGLDLELVASLVKNDVLDGSQELNVQYMLEKYLFSSDLDNTQKRIKVRLYEGSGDNLQMVDLTLNNVIFEQGGTPSDLNINYLRVPMTYRAISRKLDEPEISLSLTQ